MARKPMMAGNWKMNNTVGEAVVLTQEISNQYEKEWPESVDIVICPPFVDLKPAKTVLDFDKTKIAVGAQNVYWEPKGAFTGEISVPMIKEIGCACSIVGHSERRELFGETNEDVNTQGEGARRRGACTPSCAWASRLAVREEGTTDEYVTAQVRAAFAGVDARRRGALRGGLRAHLGHRHGPHGHARAGRGRVRRHPRDARRALRRRDGRRHARAVRRFHEPRQRGGPHGPAEHRRRARRRCQPQVPSRSCS